MEDIDITKISLLERDKEGRVIGVRWWDGNNEVSTTIPPGDRQPPTELERIAAVFKNKFNSGFSGNEGSYRWSCYLRGLGFQESFYEVLLELLYSDELGNKIALKNPSGAGTIILIDRDSAKKILVLGNLP